MTVGHDPIQQRPSGEGGRAGARLAHRLLADVRHGADLALLADVGPRRWTDALLAETRFHLAGMINAIELAIGLHISDPAAEALIGQLGAGHARRAIEDELGLLSPELLGHLRRRAAAALLLRHNETTGTPARFAAPGAGTGNEAYMDALAALGIAERRWCGPMLLDAPMRPDLPAEHYHDLAWTVAALLIRGCERLSGQGGPALIRAIAQATERLIARHDEGQGGFALALRCARSLPRAARLALAPAALIDARILLFAALADCETGLAIERVIDALIGEDDAGRHAVLRLLRIDDAVAFRAAELLAPLTALAGGGDHALVAFVEAYQVYGEAQAELWLAGMISPRALTEKLALMDRQR
jgi:hypothetical protein